MQTTISNDGQSIANETLFSHAFVGRVERSYKISRGRLYVNTRGTGRSQLATYGAINLSRDAINQVHGPQIFQQIDEDLRNWFKRNVPGC